MIITNIIIFISQVRLEKLIPELIQCRRSINSVIKETIPTIANVRFLTDTSVDYTSYIGKIDSKIAKQIDYEAIMIDPLMSESRKVIKQLTDGKNYEGKYK